MSNEMSIANSFTNSREYFAKCLDFLQAYSWIYESSNTCIIRDNIFEKFPREWKQYFTSVTNEEINSFPDRCLKTNKPTLDVFLQELDKLIPNHVQLNISNIEYSLKKISPKKQHEISKLSSLIRTICADQIDILIDFGSGLGYLSELLHKLDSYKILGIESDASRVRTSRERQDTTYPTSKPNVMFEEHFVTNESKDFILNHVQKMSPDSSCFRLAIVGLHACADLTINSMKLFFSMNNVQKLIIMPCCYHKLEIETDPSKGAFKNFPLSKALKEAEINSKTFCGFNRPFLRLACQQTSARWKNLTEKEHNEHSADMFLRAVAEAILKTDEMVIKLKSKKAIKQLNFTEMCNIYELRSKTTKERITWTSEHEHRFSEIIQKYPNGPKLAEGLTCLQATIQKLCENVVLYDRLCYMEEMAVEYNLNITVKFEKIMDELLSPRCYVLIAQKL